MPTVVPDNGSLFVPSAKWQMGAKRDANPSNCPAANRTPIKRSRRPQRGIQIDIEENSHGPFAADTQQPDQRDDADQNNRHGGSVASLRPIRRVRSVLTGSTWTSLACHTLPVRPERPADPQEAMRIGRVRPHPMSCRGSAPYSPGSRPPKRLPAKSGNWEERRLGTKRRSCVP